jgi:predicted enzyme related to lactoylglutathione lyase
MRPHFANPVVHLELRTGNSARACDFYGQMFSWRIETVREEAGSYLAFDPAFGIQGGVVEIDSDLAFWLPYIEVPNVVTATERGRSLGASVALAPREGPAGWRSILVGPDGEQVALWEPKR